MLIVPVNMLQALPKLRLMVWADAPVYEPEKLMGLPAAAERDAKFCPRAMPEMVFDERRLVPIEVLATTFPAPFVERMALARLVKPKLVVVALV